LILQKIIKFQNKFIAINSYQCSRKKNEKVKFRFDTKDDSQKVSANSVEKSGYGYEWVKYMSVGN